MRNEETRCNEYQDTDQEGHDVQQQNQGQVQFHGCFTDIVDLRVETHEARVLL